MFLSLCYVVLRRILQLAVLHVRSNDFKDLEIVVLRHELAILGRPIRRPAMTWTDRLFLAAASRLLPRARWRSFIITPGTLLPPRCAGLTQIVKPAYLAELNKQKLCLLIAIRAPSIPARTTPVLLDAAQLIEFQHLAKDFSSC